MRNEENETTFMTVGALRKMLEGVADDTEVYIRCCTNLTGNIVEAGIAAKSDYGFFGTSIPCIIIEPADDSYAVK
jgi:hypothetical protein